MTNQPTEIAIVGGGMVGGALALGLAQHGFTVTVIEHAQPAPFVADSQPDVRISAISAASVSLLKGGRGLGCSTGYALPSLPQTGNVGVGNGACRV